MKTKAFLTSTSPSSVTERQLHLSRLKNLDHLQTPGMPGKWHATEFSFYEFCFHKVHPFRLEKVMGVRDNFAFTGGGQGKVITTVSINFLTNVHFIVGHESHRRPKALRRIEAPFPDGDPEHHYVFFELINAQGYIISGETTNFGEDSYADMQILDECFATLSKSFGITVESFALETVGLDDLYKKEPLFTV